MVGPAGNIRVFFVEDFTWRRRKKKRRWWRRITWWSNDIVTTVIWRRRWLPALNVVMVTSANGIVVTAVATVAAVVTEAEFSHCCDCGLRFL